MLTTVEMKNGELITWWLASPQPLLTIRLSAPAGAHSPAPRSCAIILEAQKPPLGELTVPRLYSSLVGGSRSLSSLLLQQAASLRRAIAHTCTGLRMRLQLGSGRLICRATDGHVGTHSGRAVDKSCSVPWWNSLAKSLAR